MTSVRGLRRFALVVFFSLLFTTPQLPLSAADGGAPKVSRARLGVGFSIKFYRSSVAELTCLVENPDSKAHKISLYLKSEETFAQGLTGVYIDTLDMPAGTSLEYKTPVMLGASERYILEYHVDGQRKADKNDMSVRLMPVRTAQIGVLNDQDSSSIGSLPKAEAFKDACSVVSLSSMTFPSSWTELADFSSIVIFGFDTAQFAPAQYEALLNYVCQGGTVVFGSPASIPAYANTPLVSLLPVTPAKARLVSDAPSLRKLAPEFKGWGEDSHKTVFLESAPCGGGVTLVSEGEFPVSRWMKYGLGSCRFSAVPLNEEAYAGQKPAWEKLMSHFLSTQPIYPAEKKFSECLDEMTGFPIPSALFIKMVLGVYLVILAAALVGGRMLRRPGLALLAAAVCAALFTAFILFKAETLTGGKGKLFTSLKIFFGGRESAPTLAYSSIFSDKDATLDIGAASEKSVMTTIPPDRTSFIASSFAMGQQEAAGKKRGGMGQQQAAAGQGVVVRPLEIGRVNGMPALKNMNVPTKTSRQFREIGEAANPLAEFAARPELALRENAMQMQPWTLPENRQYDYAFLLLQSGIFPLNVSGKKVSFNGGSKDFLFQSDRVMSLIMRGLDQGLRKSSPCVALVGKAPSPGFSLPEGTNMAERVIDLIPLSTVCDKGRFAIPPEMIVMTPGCASTRMVMTGNRLENILDSRGALAYSFYFTIPPEMAMMDVDEVIVNFTYRNQGGNISARPMLSKNGREANPDAKGVRNRAEYIKTALCKPASEEAGRYVFKGDDVKGAVEKISGRGFLLIDAREINEKLTAEQKVRANKWAPATLSVEVRGRMPENLAPFKY